jgi:hypothetical protein
MMQRPMKILAVATKSPLPPVDGGRLLMWNTLSALCASGHEIDLLVPENGSAGTEEIPKLPPGLRIFVVGARPRSRMSSLVRSLLTRRPVSIARHSHAAITRAVEERLREGDYDVLHVEQLQALDAVERAAGRRPPIVLRAQNVESELWAGMSGLHDVRRAVARWEAWRLRRWESAALTRVDVTVTLTESDAAALRELAGGNGLVVSIPAPFPSHLPAAATLEGAPAIVYLGSAGWPPNRDAWRWFAADVWPHVHTRLPAARLHVFQRDVTATPAAGVIRHEPPQASGECFARGSVLVVPLRVGSGIRIRILEAWARGVPVVATPAAAAGLQATDGSELLLAATGGEFARALERLWGEPGLREALVAAGRRRLASRHDKASVAAAWSRIYEDAVESARRRVASTDIN